MKKSNTMFVDYRKFLILKMTKRDGTPTFKSFCDTGEGSKGGGSYRNCVSLLNLVFTWFKRAAPPRIIISSSNFSWSSLFSDGRFIQGFSFFPFASLSLSLRLLKDSSFPQPQTENLFFCLKKNSCHSNFFSQNQVIPNVFFFELSLSSQNNFPKSPTIGHK